MWVNCYLCTICNGANLFYQVFTSSRNTHLHLRALSAVPGRDARSVWFSWGLKGKPAPGAACLAACHARCSAGAGSERLTFPKAVLCACRNQALLTLPVSPAAKSESCHTGKSICFLSVSLSLQIHSLITLYPVQNRRLKDATQNLPVLG